ncbi:unnamed protein product, partial [marine sediment metagenome]
LRISTMTAICSINLNIDLGILYEYIDLSNDSYPYVKSCQYGTDNIKGDFKKKKTKRKKKPVTAKRNYFQNQATLIIVISEERKVNLKIFRNGKIQMTGLKSKDEGIVACEKLIDEITRISKIDEKISGDQKIESIISDFSIVLINSLLRFLSIFFWINWSFFLPVNLCFRFPEIQSSYNCLIFILLVMMILKTGSIFVKQIRDVKN